MRRFTLCIFLTQTLFVLFFMYSVPSIIPSEVRYESVEPDNAFTRSARNVDLIMNDPTMVLQAFIKDDSLLEDDRTVLCLRQAGLAPAGGIETWFWTFAKHVFK